MRVLVVGGTRFIGPRLLQRLMARGHEVTVFHRGTTEPENLPAVRHIRHPAAEYPICTFPSEVLAHDYDAVVHMVLMGEADARAFVSAFGDRAGRLVAVSSGDVYRAYGRWTGFDPGPIEPTPLREDAPLRDRLYPYRSPHTLKGTLEHVYEKVLVERELMRATTGWTILRLSKVYGPGDNERLETVYGARAHPNWRWTHGYVENVAEAIALAAIHPAAEGRIFNVGEEITPTTGERLTWLPPMPEEPTPPGSFNFAQSLEQDTSAIRRELGYRDLVDEREAMILTVRGECRRGPD